jgi:hypothetical protein
VKPRCGNPYSAAGEGTAPLVSWDHAEGWISHWLISSFFPAGLRHNPDPNLFEGKQSAGWTRDLLKRWGGEGGPGLPPKARGSRGAAPWLPVSLAYGPKLHLKEVRRRHTAVDTALGDADSDSWNCLWYALAAVESDRDTDVLIRFCGWDGCRLFVNGELVFDEHSYHHIIIDKEEIRVRLRKGLNTLLFKLDRDGCAARVVPVPGAKKPVLRQVVFAPAAPVRRLSTEEQLARWALEKKPVLPFRGRTVADLGRWQKTFRAHVRRCLGPFPAEVPGEAVLVEKEMTAGGVERRLYELPSEAGGVLPFYLMLPPPEKRRNRVLITAHGHEKTWREVAGVDRGPRATRLTVGAYAGNYALQLAELGWTTAVCCQRGFAARNDHRGPGDKCNHAAWMAMAQGHTYVALHLHDIRRMTRAVLGLPETAGCGAPGLLGLSGGGSLSYLLAATDPLYAAVAVFCCICRYRDYALGEGCGMQVLPLLYPTGDVSEVLSLIAPRPLLIGQGRLDAIFSVVTTRDIYREAARAWRAAGRERAVRLAVYEKAHEVDVAAANRFFMDVLA